MRVGEKRQFTLRRFKLKKFPSPFGLRIERQKWRLIDSFEKLINRHCKLNCNINDILFHYKSKARTKKISIGIIIIYPTFWGLKRDFYYILMFWIMKGISNHITVSFSWNSRTYWSTKYVGIINYANRFYSMLNTSR